MLVRRLSLELDDPEVEGRSGMICHGREVTTRSENQKHSAERTVVLAELRDLLICAGAL
jgi:hypothetical protein